MKLAEIKTILAGNPTEEQLTELKKDERAGVQKLACRNCWQRTIKNGKRKSRNACVLPTCCVMKKNTWRCQAFNILWAWTKQAGDPWLVRWSLPGSFCRRTCLSPG